MTILTEAKRLYDLGFSILWIKEKSKAPVKSKWTTGPKESWESLKKSYRTSYNVGVRLGTTSKVGDKFLAVIDCDVKSTDLKDEKEMLDTLWELFPSLANTPRVLSGRGNGSSHFYVGTDKPASPLRLAQSTKKVEVYMPSVKASYFELANLSPDKLLEGIRLRAAWEISLMGEGQQVLLPPSIHPDSKKAYRWGTKFTKEKLYPLEGALIGKEKKESAESGFKFKINFPTSEDINAVEREIWDMITTGKNVSDRSAALYIVTGQLVKAGWNDDKILTILTDNATYLGGVAFEHAKTSDRNRAAKWLFNYTLKKARHENDVNIHFANDVEVSELSEKETLKQKAEIKDRPWQELLDKTDPKNGSKPRNTLKNVVLVLENTACKEVIRRNEFANVDFYGCDTPWGGKKGKEIEDMDIVRVKFWLAEHFRFEPSDDRINQAFLKIADKNRFHPVRQYLDALDWDGQPRIDTWLKRHLKASGPEEYLRAVSRKVLCAMVARAYKAGTKFDEVLILEGGQGIGKSTAVRHLASNEWFSDTHIDIRDKDAVMSLESVWLVELGELSSIRKTDLDLLKNFIARTTDRIRVPYGKRTQSFPRQCIFIGTTNEEEYFTDKTGNRRFWPVKVGEYDFKSIIKERDQLFAEAKFVWEMGEDLHLSDSVKVLAKAEQEKRVVEDSVHEMLSIFFQKERLKKPAKRTFSLERFTMQNLFDDFGPLMGNKQDRNTQKHVGEVLRKLGFQKTVKRINGVIHKVWEPKTPMLPQ